MIKETLVLKMGREWCGKERVKTTLGEAISGGGKNRMREEKNHRRTKTPQRIEVQQNKG